MTYPDHQRHRDRAAVIAGRAAIQTVEPLEQPGGPSVLRHELGQTIPPLLCRVNDGVDLRIPAEHTLAGLHTKENHAAGDEVILEGPRP
jgi:hypothetical protein